MNLRIVVKYCFVTYESKQCIFSQCAEGCIALLNQLSEAGLQV